MVFHNYKKFLSALLLVPIATLFLACCCLKADATMLKKSSCASCPQQKDSKHQADCPHAKIKGVVDADSVDLKVVKFSLVLDIFTDLKNLVSSYQSGQFVSVALDTSQQRSSLFPQNPILRL